MIETGNKIKVLLKIKKISINSLAELTGYTRQGLSSVLKTGDFKISVLQKIADVLEVNICDFFQESDKNSFDKELKYFIELNNPFYDNEQMRNQVDKDPDFNHSFIRHTLRSMYKDFILKESLESLNKKHKRKVKIYCISDHIPNEVQLSYFDNDKRHDITFIGKPFLENILKEIYTSIDKTDISKVRTKLISNKKDFLVYLQNSIFFDWYKKTFNLEEHEIQSVLMNIRKVNIILEDNDEPTTIF